MVRIAMTEHADHRFSATLSSRDLALIGCLRSLADFSHRIYPLIERQTPFGPDRLLMNCRGAAAAFWPERVDQVRSRKSSAKGGRLCAALWAPVRPWRLSRLQIHPLPGCPVDPTNAPRAAARQFKGFLFARRTPIPPPVLYCVGLCCGFSPIRC